MFRKRIGQEVLALKLALTFQQLQRYERGTNRISASKLYETACALDVAIDDFIEDGRNEEGTGKTADTPTPARELLTSSDGLELETRADVRPRLVGMVEAITDADGAGHE